MRKMCILKKFQLRNIYPQIYSGYFFRDPLSGDSRLRQFVIGAPRAGEKRHGTVFVGQYTDGQETVTKVKKVYGEWYEIA